MASEEGTRTFKSTADTKFEVSARCAPLPRVKTPTQQPLLSRAGNERVSMVKEMGPPAPQYFVNCDETAV